MKQNAFSLIELLVVVAIIAVLAAIAIPMYSQYSIKARIAGTMSTLEYYSDGIQQALTMGSNIGT